MLSPILHLLGILGILIALFGIVADYILPSASPGYNPPQLLVIAGGLVLAVGASFMRLDAARKRLFGPAGKSILAGLTITVTTLIVLEFALTRAGVSTYFPTLPPDYSFNVSPWWICDKAGCHFDYDAVQVACESGELDGRPCLVNRQGFPDTQNFDPTNSPDSEPRILMLGDSFTFGFDADIGKSFVETLKTEFAGSAIWNAGMPGTGTQQALASFDVYGPMLRPQITVLGFFTNDFDDNLLPLDSWLNAVDSGGNAIVVRKYLVDEQENVFELDLKSIGFLTIYGKAPPKNEFERRLGLTRLGTLLLRLNDSIGELSAGPERFVRRVDLTRRYLRDLREAVSAQDSAFLVLLIPGRDDLVSRGKAYQTAIDLMEELEMHYLNPAAILDGERDYALWPNVHWNNSGHQKVGALLSECIEKFIASGKLSDCESVTIP